MASLIWRGPQFIKMTEAQAARGLRTAAFDLHRLSRKAASIPNIRSKGKWRHSSKPGEAPRRRTGFGQKNIVKGFSRQLMEARVGHRVTSKYMIFHEVGIKYSKAGKQVRSSVIQTLKDNRERIAAAFKLGALKRK